MAQGQCVLHATHTRGLVDQCVWLVTTVRELYLKLLVVEIDLNFKGICKFVLYCSKEYHMFFELATIIMMCRLIYTSLISSTFYFRTKVFERM